MIFNNCTTTLGCCVSSVTCGTRNDSATVLSKVTGVQLKVLSSRSRKQSRCCSSLVV